MNWLKFAYRVARNLSVNGRGTLKVGKIETGGVKLENVEIEASEIPQVARAIVEYAFGKKSEGK